MRRRSFVFTPQVDADGFCQSQTPGAGGSLTMNGALVTSGVGYSMPSGSVGGQKVVITAVGNESGRTFTITGTDVMGRALSVTVTGPNATTASTTAYFATVTDVSVDAATAGAVTVGVTGVAGSPIYVPNYLSTDGNIAMVITITGTVSVTVKHSIGDPFDGTAYHSYRWDDHADLAAITATDSGNYEYLPTMIQFTTDSFTAGGSAIADFVCPV